MPERITLVIKDTKNGEREIPIISMGEARRLVHTMSESKTGVIKETGQVVDTNSKKE